jgi:hypothetical protein
MNAAVYEKLKQVARDHKLITYTELGRAADLDVAHLPDLDKLVKLLTEIADHEVAQNRPLLVAVVIREDLGMPSKGLFQYARAKGLQGKKTDEVTFFAEELKRVYEAWKPPPGENPAP